MITSTSLLKKLAPLALALALTQLASAQLKTPAASPRSVIKQTVGLTEFEIDYSRPSVKGRDIFGGLVPFDAVWRTGANNPTVISFTDEIVVAGKKIPAGKYALYTIPNQNEWTVIFYRDTDLWGAFGYDKSKDVARVSVAPYRLKTQVETMTFGFGALKNDGAQLYLDWDYIRVPIPIEVPTDKKVMSQISKMKGTPKFEKSETLFAAGTYYHETGKDLEVALEWVSKACELQENPAYWMVARKASIERDLGLKEKARESAEKTLKLATEGGNPDYQKIAKDILSSL